MLPPFDRRKRTMFSLFVPSWGEGHGGKRWGDVFYMGHSWVSFIAWLMPSQMQQQDDLERPTFEQFSSQRSKEVGTEAVFLF